MLQVYVRGIGRGGGDVLRDSIQGGEVKCKGKQARTQKKRCLNEEAATKMEKKAIDNEEEWIIIQQMKEKEKNENQKKQK